MPKIEKQMAGILGTKYAGIDFKNPLVQSSGNLGLSLASLKRSIEAGVAAVTIKSASVGSSHEYRSIYPHPTMSFLPKGFGLNNTMVNWGSGFILLEQELNLIQQIKPLAKDNNCLIIGSLSADEAKLQYLPEFEQAVRKIAEAGADLLEIVVSCPYICESDAEQLELDKKLVSTLFRIAKEATGIPVISKIAYEYHAYFLEILEVLKNIGIKNIHVFTRYRGTVIDIEKGEPVVPGPSALYYGALRRPASNRATAIARDFDSDLQIISSGGIWRANDCIERLMCGANLVGVHTAINYHGQGLFVKIIDGLTKFLSRKRLELDEITGIAVHKVVDQQAFSQYMESLDIPKDSLTLVVDLERCSRCGLCTNCIFGAWNMRDEGPVLDLNLCERCGICLSLCPAAAIKMERN